MAETALIFGLVSGAAGLATACSGAARTLHRLAAKYKESELSIRLLVQQVTTIKTAWDRIRNWSESCEENLHPSLYNIGLLQRLEQSLECGDLVISSLEGDLLPYKKELKRMKPRQRSKAVWNDSLIQIHQNRLRDQVSTMLLLLQVLDLPSTQDQQQLLRQSEPQLRKCDESAFSLVPSDMSSWRSLSTARASSCSQDTAAKDHRRFSFEDLLFTARVYKRNYRTPRIWSLLHRSSHEEDMTSDGQKSATPSATGGPSPSANVPIVATSISATPSQESTTSPVSISEASANGTSSHESTTSLDRHQEVVETCDSCGSHVPVEKIQQAFSRRQFFSGLILLQDSVAITRDCSCGLDLLHSMIKDEKLEIQALLGSVEDRLLTLFVEAQNVKDEMAEDASDRKVSQAENRPKLINELDRDFVFLRHIFYALSDTSNSTPLPPLVPLMSEKLEERVNLFDKYDRWEADAIAHQSKVTSRLLPAVHHH